MIGGYLGQRPTPECQYLLKMHALGDAFSLIWGAKSRAFRTDFYQVTGNKVMMNCSVDCFYCLLITNFRIPTASEPSFFLFRDIIKQ